MRVILITKEGASVKEVSSEHEVASLLSNSFHDDVLVDYIDLDNGLTLLYNDGDLDPNWSYENVLAKQLTTYALLNPVVICRFVDPDAFLDLTDLLDSDIIRFSTMLEDINGNLL